MLRVLLMCTDDRASVNIRDRLVETGEMEIVGEFNDRPVRYGKGFFLFEKEGMHLYLDGIDREISEHIDKAGLSSVENAPETSNPLDLLVFLSKHRSEREIDSLTVHPPGNYLGADYGGEANRLCPAHPHMMTTALRSLYRVKKGLGLKDRTTFEVTHHGPLVDSPCFFIEIGSGPARWDVPVLGEAIAGTLLCEEFTESDSDLPIAIGIGGGHYAPRFTDRALRGKFDFGHMIPDYILSGFDDSKDPVKLALDATPGAEHIFIHRSKRNRELLRGIEDVAAELGLAPHS